ncbi:MAG: ATP-binding protein [Bradymonadales bacterium]|nr:ATP-binding protein [Bradymonadales bacterium]
MIHRNASSLIRERLANWPAAAILGPRQSGKTTLAQTMKGRYFDLEQEPDRLKLDLAWPELAAGNQLVVLDEAQAWPPVFERLRAAIDADRKRAGRFLLLGSVSPRLMSQVSESLAGRLALIELSPLSLAEVGFDRLDDLWLHGGYPDGGILDGRHFPQWQRNYLELLAARDLPLWGLPARPQVTDRLFRMLSAVHGQLWNASRIGAGLGLTHPTVNSYLDYLAGAYLVRRLPPWHGNLSKRLTRTPKLYWRDSGLLHALHLVADLDDLLGRPWVGASWEGFVIEQAITTLLQTGAPFEASFFRTSDQHEIDLLLQLQKSCWAIEVKLTTQPSPSDATRLTRAAELVGADRRFLVTRTPEVITDGPLWSCRLEHLVEALQAGL